MYSRFLAASTVILVLGSLLTGSHPAVAQTTKPGSKPSASSSALPAGIEQLDTQAGITEYRLRSNGMNILLSPNHAAPVITFMVVYHVGSRNEAPGNTGSAHLLEHLLFNKSTQNFGKAHGKPTFQEVLAEAGADFGSSNMTTWFDRMTGYSTLPADRVELAMKIEADRLGRALLLDSERQPEMTVVRNEYEIGENDPAEALDKAVIGAAIVAHPYHWSTIGYRSDIEGVSTEKLREHYKNFFHPDNATAILVGDFDTRQALTIFAREFGAYPRSKTPIPQVITQEPPQEGERRVVVRRPGQLGLVEIAYLRPGSLSPDFIPLDVLQAILGFGVNSRLYQALVEKRLATEAAAQNYTLKDPYPFVVTATLAPGVSHQRVEDVLKAELARVVKDGVTHEELARAKSQIEVNVIRGRDGTYEFASSLGEAVASADWKWFVHYVDAMKAVTADDVKRVASTYLVPDHATVGWFVPITEESGGASGAKAAAKRGATDVPFGTRLGGAGPRYGADPREGVWSSKPRGGSGESGNAGAASSAAGSSAAASSTAKTASKNGAGARRAFADRTVRRVLSNGIVLDIVENHAVPTVAIQGIVLAGKMAAPAGKPALPELTAMMLTRGTRSADKRVIAARLDGVGAQQSIESGPYHTIVTGSGLSRDLPLLLETLADELANPAFRDSELTKAKLELRNDALQAFDNTRQRAVDRATQLAFPVGHPYHAATRDEMLASIDQAKMEDLRAFHRDRYVGAGTCFAIVGDVNPRDAATLFEKAFGQLTAGSKPSYSVATTQPGPPVRELIAMRGKANLDLVYAHASGLKRTDRDFNAALIANAVLGQSALTARLGKRIRDTEGLSYTLASRFLMSDVIDGLWLTDIKLAPQNLAKAMNSAREVMQDYAANGPTAAEVESQKSFFAGNFQVQLANNAGVANALVTAEKFGFGPTYLDEFPVWMRAVTRDQVVEAMKAHIKPEAANIIVAGDVPKLPD
jgi:zinc protease